MIETRQEIATLASLPKAIDHEVNEREVSVVSVVAYLQWAVWASGRNLDADDDDDDDENYDENYDENLQ